MVESSDLQGAIQRTQAMERIQQLQSQQEELNRKRFELELARRRAEKQRKVSDIEKAGHKVVEDRYDGDESEEAPRDDRQKSPRGEDERGGNLDVRV